MSKKSLLFVNDVVLTGKSSFPPDNDEKQKQLGEFFQTYPPPKVAGQVPDFVSAVKAKDSSISKFGILGVRPPFPLYQDA